MLGRFLIFTGESYYPNGGAADFNTSAPTLDEAKFYAEAWLKGAGVLYWANILDAQTGALVWSEENRT